MKMKSLSLIQLLLGIVLPQAMAQTSTDIAFREQLEIQSHLRNEVLTVLRDVDPKASVSVEITVQTQIAPLPGSGLKPVETVNLGESNHLYPSVIQKTIVRINTALNPVPEWLRKTDWFGYTNRRQITRNRIFSTIRRRKSILYFSIENCSRAGKSQQGNERRPTITGSRGARKFAEIISELPECIFPSGVGWTRIFCIYVPEYTDVNPACH